MALKNYDKVKRRIEALPAAVKEAAGAQLAEEIEGLVEQIKDNAPVSDLEAHPGELRESVHSYPNPDRPLSYRIIADAKDEKGKFIGAHVEFGHLSGKRGAPDRHHVSPMPFFFPSYRKLKKPIRRRMLAAGRKAVKALFS